MAGKTTLTDTPTGAMIACESSRMSGPLKRAAGCPVPGSGSLTTAVVRAVATDRAIRADG